MTRGPKVDRVPWSDLGPEFARDWGRSDPKDPQPEHVEIIGQNGSGKTFFLCKVLQERMILRNTPSIIVATKPADGTLNKLGWPIVSNLKEASKHRQMIFWPTTDAIGAERKASQEDSIYNLLSRLWKPGANTIIAFDEIAYAESLSARMRDVIEMYWREARSQGITVIGMKQRPQGANRHMSSETSWTIAYPPKDRQDTERFAELFGAKQIWMPIIDSLDREEHEFLIKHVKSGTSYISNIDTPLKPIEPTDDNKMATYLGHKKSILK